MTREQFIQAAGALYDMMAGGSAPAPAAPGGGSPPRFDTSIARKGGMVQWASECSLRELNYWVSKKSGPSSDPKYAESDAKQLRALQYWVAYRQANPTAVWSGERNRVQITAAPPSDKPQQYPRGVVASAPTTPTPSFDDSEPDPDYDSFM